MNRRSFLASILAAGVAPAVSRGGILMPVRRVWLPVSIIGCAWEVPDLATVLMYGDEAHAMFHVDALRHVQLQHGPDARILPIGSYDVVRLLTKAGHGIRARYQVMVPASA